MAAAVPTVTWESKFPSAGLNLVSVSLEKCQAKLEEYLAEHEARMQWLEEIVEEASKKMAEKSTTLEQMPKTPSMKQKAQKRGRRHKKSSDVLRQINEENGTPTLPKTKTKLTFDSDSPEEKQSTALGRGLRTRTLSVKYAEEENLSMESAVITKPTGGKRNSRKPVTKKTAIVVKPETVEDMDTQSDKAEEEEQVPPVVQKRPTTALSRDNQSPSVKDRATAYEAMIQDRVSKSPAKRGTTPKTPTSAKGATAPGKTPTSGSVVASISVGSKGKGKRLSSCKSLRKSARCSSTIKRSRHTHSTKKKSVELPRANRTRLRLKKVQQQKEDTETTDSEEPTETTKTAPQKPLLPPEPVVTDQSSEMDEDSDTKTTQQAGPPDHKSLDDTEIMVTEVYELQPGVPMELKTYERQQTKTMPVSTESSVQLSESPVISCTQPRPCLSSDQGFNDGDDEEEEEDMEEPVTKKVKSTHTRVRAQLKEMESLKKTCTLTSNTTDNKSNLNSDKLDATFTTDVQNNQRQEESSPISRSSRTRTWTQQPEEAQAAAAKNIVEEPVRSTRTRQKNVSQESSPSRSTRTRTRTQQPEEAAATSKDQIEEPMRSTRTRQKKVSQDSTFSKDHEETSLPQQHSTRTRTRLMQQLKGTVEEEPVVRSTRTRQRAKQEEQNKSEVCQQKSVPMLLSDDEVVAGSPIPGTPKPSAHGKKRLMEERGSSPRPKRSRSCIGNSIVRHVEPPLSSSSPVKKGHQEEDDIVLSPTKTKKTPPRAYPFTNNQKKVKSFLNRTPGFSQNSTQLYSFLHNSSASFVGTPSMRNNVVTSFLKRHATPPSRTIQAMQEQKKQKLIEKEKKDKERLKKAAEQRKKKVEEQKRQREEKARKVAEAKEQRMQQELEQKERLNKKLVQNAAIKEKLMEEKTKEEREKQKLRLKKQQEADARRKQEEEERKRKQLEQEEEARQQEEFMQRKREFEEAERKRQIAEEKKRQEERLAEIEQKRQEEIARLKRQEEEKQQERERQRQEREKLLAMEKAERERIERQKRDLKEKKLALEMEKLRALEKERMERQAQEALQLQKVREEQLKMQKMIQQHNQKVSTHTATSTATGAGSSGAQPVAKSYEMTPVKKKVLVSKNPHDYGLDDKDSDDSTDDDEAPKKKIPEWAMGTLLNIALIRQATQPPDLDKIFRFEHIEAPDLEILFPNVKRRRFKQRTSSAIWTSPIVKH